MPKLIFEKHFIRLSNKLIKRSPEIDSKLSEVLRLLQSNPNTPSLKTHTLYGKLKGKYACTLTFDLRVIFKYSDNTIHLLDIGSHDEVY
ncbi:MAG: type II toxin-antitoxin system RelE/ParE family toxin [Candidatus Anammoxibacter sp.]